MRWSSEEVKDDEFGGGLRLSVDAVDTLWSRTPSPMLYLATSIQKIK